MRAFILLLLLCVTATQPMKAGSLGGRDDFYTPQVLKRDPASVDWDSYALPILRRNPALLKVIDDSLDVQRIGRGDRIRPDSDGAAVSPLALGARIPPFEFPARRKGSLGVFDLMLIIHDEDIGKHETKSKETWIEIRPRI
jgi:hypothetical protein